MQRNKVVNRVEAHIARLIVIRYSLHASIVFLKFVEKWLLSLNALAQSLSILIEKAVRIMQLEIYQVKCK